MKNSPNPADLPIAAPLAEDNTKRAVSAPDDSPASTTSMEAAAREIISREEALQEQPPAIPKQAPAKRGNARSRRAERRRITDESVPRVRREFRRSTEDYSYAYCTVEHCIYSDAAQQFFERNFQWVDRSLLVITLVSGAVGGAELARRFTDEAEALGRNLQKQLIAYLEALQQGLNAKNIPEAAQVPGYDHKRVYHPAVHSPQAMQFITLTGLLDRVIARIEGAWIHGVINAERRQTSIREWLDECRSYVRALQALRIKTMQEALNAGKRQEAKLIERTVELDPSNGDIAGKAEEPPAEEAVSASREQEEKPEDGVQAADEGIQEVPPAPVDAVPAAPLEAAQEAQG